MGKTIINELYAALVSLVKRYVPMHVVPYKVVSLNSDNATCVLKEEDGAEIENVRLKSVIDDNNVGIVVYPLVGSSVLAGKINNDENNLYVTKINEIDSVLITIKDKFKAELKPSGELIFNDGENKGLVIHDEVKKNLENLKDYCDSIENAAGLIASALDGLVPGTSVAYNGVTEPAKAACIISEMENDKIKH